MSGKRVAIYARVSTRDKGQDVENQLSALRQVAKRAGWTVAHEFVDDGISGAKGRDQRPQFDALCRDVARRRVGMVAAWSSDRLSRSLRDLVGFLEDLRAANVDLYLHTQGVDTSTPTGRAMFGMLSVFSELERELIRERVHAGLERARANGKTLGRPSIDHETADKVRDLADQGLSKRRIAREVGISDGTVRNVLAEAAG